MNSINTIASSSSYVQDGDAADERFNDKVRHYFQQAKPEQTLGEMMNEMRALSPDRNVSMHQLNEALLYADTCLRNSDAFKDYAYNVLDKRASQLLGVNMLFNNMMYKSFNETDSDPSL
ncbi:type III secretion system protein [uncultured Pantoea sp.]|uniref:type III secretion system protein n=1 Tax=uncultured Pantoea sp. TaxID=218084 RepID=UPI00258C0720|nr:type III secretion system protein [uncultured Pantoea sp.]